MNIKKLNIQENFLKSKNHKIDGFKAPVGIKCRRCNKPSEVFVANIDTFERVC